LDKKRNVLIRNLMEFMDLELMQALIGGFTLTLQQKQFQPMSLIII